MQLLTHRRSRAAVGLVAAAAAAGTAFLATPAVAADDPTAGLRCQIDNGWDELGVSCYDDVAGQRVTVVDFQWERDGVAIPGATGSAIEVKPEDYGHLYSATVGVDRDGTRVTVPIGRADDSALFLMDGCDVKVSNRLNHPEGMDLLGGKDLSDTLTLKVNNPIASGLTVSGPYWTVVGAEDKALPPGLAGRAQGWTVALSELVSIDALLGSDRPGRVEVHNSFVVKAGDVSAEAGGCPWGPDAPMGTLDLSRFGSQIPQFPIGGHAAGDTGATGALTASTKGWPEAATFTYQWTRDGQAIAGATSESYTLTADDSGKKIGLVVWGTVDGTTAWIWGEVTAGQIKAPAAGGTETPTASPSATAGASQDSTVPLAGAASDAKAQSGSPSTLAKTGSTVLPVVGLAVLLLAGGAVVLVVRRRAQLG